MRARNRWRLSRSDLASGGRAVLWLHHPLLPALESALLTEEGLVLPAVPSPSPLGAGLAGQEGEYFTRLVGLLAFLRWAGLGVAPEDVFRIGRARGARPALGAAPVPEWRALPPGVVLAAAAVAAAGGAGEVEPDGRGIGRAAAAIRTEPCRGVAAAGIRSAERGERPESLLARIAGEVGAQEGGEDFLGLLYPVCSLAEGAGSVRPACAGGPGSLFAARGAARRRSLSFVEVTPGEGLEAGAALRGAADRLGPGPGDRIRALVAQGAPGRPERGPEIVLLARETDRWDQRSRTAFETLAADDGFFRVEAREHPAPPWEDRDPVPLRLSLAEVSSILYLPYEEFAGGMAAWEEVARHAHDDAGRFLRAARQAAASFRPGDPGSRGTPSPPRRSAVSAADPVLDAAAVLADGFDAVEAAAASDRGEADVRRRLEGAALEGLLLEVEGAYRFADPEARSSRVARLAPAALRGVVERLAAADTAPERLAVAALARGEEADRRAARKLFAEAGKRGDRKTGLALLARAGAADPDLGDPVWSVELLHHAGRTDEARARAGRLVPVSLAEVSLERRSRVARLLSRLGLREKALELSRSIPGEAGRLLEVRILLDAHAEREAEALLVAGAEPAGSPQRWALLRAEAASRAKDLARASRELEAALELLDEPEDLLWAYETALTAGWVASDLGRPGEAVLFFRRARDVAPDEGRRADARVDLQVALLALGKLEEAAAELGEALVRFAASGERDRYLSALGNRAEVFLAAGDYRSARADLDRLLPWDRDPARAFQFLFTASTLQRVALADGDLFLGAEIFDEARERLRASPSHDAAREILVLEGARRLAAGDAAGAVESLEEAGRLPEMRVQNEPLRARLLASAAIDLGRGGPSLPGASADERCLLAAERRLAAGEGPGAEAVRLLARLAGEPRRAGEVTGRILEWASRFPAAFRRPDARPLLDAGGQAAAMAGLAGAAGRFSLLLDALDTPVRRGGEPAERIESIDGRKAVHASSGVVAEDESTRAALRIVARVAPTALPVVIYGETGTGKEVAARELHRLSGRRGPFVAVNVAAIPDTLAEAELFGHARGAFTGADRERRGVVEESSGGTLFLDEIGELPLPVQAKLLRVLQERSVRRLGETVERPLDLRVVAATHRDLAARSAAGLFRQDLYYRLAGADVTLAPLRERPKDLAALADRILGGRISLAPAARRLVLRYAWPGNVRELVSALESAAVLAAPARSIDVAHLPRALQVSAAPPPAAAPTRRRYFDALEEVRRRTIEEALAEAGGNRTKAAALLGLSRQSLLYELKKLRLV